MLFCLFGLFPFQVTNYLLGLIFITLGYVDASTYTPSSPHKPLVTYHAPCPLVNLERNSYTAYFKNQKSSDE